MDSTLKMYQKHGMDTRDHLELYFSNKEDMVFGDDSLKFPMMNLHYQFSSGQIEGELMIDVTISSVIHHFYAASNVFKDIIVLKFNEKCIMEMSRWLNDHTGAYDWTHASAAAAELTGKREELQDQEMRIKSSIKQILNCDFEQENITSPAVLPLADCVTSGLILDVISKTKEEYVRNLEKMVQLLKPGGKLLISGLLDATYKTVGGMRYHMLKYNERFAKSAIVKVGLVIDYCAVQKRRNVSDLTDYGAIMFIAACKGE